MSVILLTSSVFPSAPVAIASPTQRLTECIAAIRMWSSLPSVDEIVVCDASNFKPLCCQDIIHGTKRLEWLSYDLSPIARVFGKGRAQAVRIERALDDMQCCKTRRPSTSRLVGCLLIISNGCTNTEIKARSS